VHQISVANQKVLPNSVN